ncbi:MAG: hypothetical protein AAF743_05380 [Planctomycetota bacterium]
MSELETDVKAPTGGNRRWYSYSFDRETFTGRFASRDEALLGANEAVRDRSEMPEAIYVARRVPVDLFERGHAKDLVQAIRDEARSNGGDVSYIKHLDQDDLDDLDASIARCVRNWAKRRELTPDVEHFEAVSEHPVPLIAHVDQPDTDEVGEVGADRL